MANLQFIFKRDASNILKMSSGDGADHDFRSTFGCGIQVCCTIWQLCVASGELPAGTLHHHMLWALLYLKLAGTYNILSRMVGATRKTYVKWIWPIIKCMAGRKVVVVCSLVICFIFIVCLLHFSNTIFV
jgi:hypothetical protein